MSWGAGLAANVFDVFLFMYVVLLAYGVVPEEYGTNAIKIWR